MIYALSENNERVCARQSDKKSKYFCPLCGKKVIPKQMNEKIWQFYHIEPCTDNWTYDMSEWRYLHLMQYKKKNCEVYLSDGTESHRADVFINDTVIMFRHAYTTEENISRQTDFFVNCGYKVIWLFDMQPAFQNNNIIGTYNGNKYTWANAPDFLTPLIPQIRRNVAVVFQLTDSKFIKVDWAKTIDENKANYSVFYTDEYFKPDITTITGIRTLFLNKEERFSHFLNQNEPYDIKLFNRVRGHRLSSYICPIVSKDKMTSTENWHNNRCQECKHNLINEFRHNSEGKITGYYYCCYPRIVNRIDPRTKKIKVLTVNTKE